MTLNSVEDTDWSAVSMPNPSPAIIRSVRLFTVCSAEEDSIPLESRVAPLLRPSSSSDRMTAVISGGPAAEKQGCEIYSSE